jgi:predicted permease
MRLSVIIDSIFSLFIIMLVGVYGARKKIITAQMNKGLIDILIRIALPCLILSSFILTYDDATKSNVIKTFFYSIAVYTIVIIVSYLLLLPIKNDKKTILHFANVFTNTGYVGFPVLNSIYGAEGIVYGSVFNMFFVILVWTYGIFLYSGSFEKKEFKAELKKVLLNPSILAVCLGVIIMFFDIRLPGAMLSGIKSIGNITGPLSMIIIGVILSDVKIKDYIRDWTIYYGVTVKLVAIPLTIYLLSLLTGEVSKAMNSVVIMTAMPSAAMTSILAENYDKDKDYAAVIVAATTLLSLVTVTGLLSIII